MEKPELNLPLFQKVYDQITSQPETFDMESWESDDEYEDSCGTTRCVAGWALYFHEGQRVFDYNYPEEPVSTFQDCDDHTVPARACKALGLTRSEGANLWYAREDEALAMVAGYLLIGRVE